MFVDLVGQLNRRYLATAFSSLVGSLTSCRAQTNGQMDKQSQSVCTAGKMELYYILILTYRADNQ